MGYIPYGTGLWSFWNTAMHITTGTHRFCYHHSAILMQEGHVREGTSVRWLFKNTADMISDFNMNYPPYVLKHRLSFSFCQSQSPHFHMFALSIVTTSHKSGWSPNHLRCRIWGASLRGSPPTRRRGQFTWTSSLGLEDLKEHPNISGKKPWFPVSCRLSLQQIQWPKIWSFKNPWFWPAIYSWNPRNHRSFNLGFTNLICFWGGSVIHPPIHIHKYRQYTYAHMPVNMCI